MKKLQIFYAKSPEISLATSPAEQAVHGVLFTFNLRTFGYRLLLVIGTENVVTHALPNLSEEKKEEEKRGGKEGKFAFFSLEESGSAWVTTFSVPITTLGTSDGKPNMLH